jgi:competence protein ComEC
MPIWASFKERLTALEIPLIYPKLGTVKWGDVELEWLWASAGRELSENDASLALVISRDGAQVLLSGDLEAKGEARLRREWRLRAKRAMSIQRGGPSLSPITLWQANHHGSRTSTHPETLEQIAPRAVILSLGERNRFGFPHPEVIKRLADRAISRWRLDIEGHIVARLTPRGLSIGPLGR